MNIKHNRLLILQSYVFSVLLVGHLIALASTELNATNRQFLIKQNTRTNQPRIVCYYTSWAVYRGNASMFPEDIDPFLCTHIIYAFATIEDGRLKEYDPADKDKSEGGECMIRRVRHLKCVNPNLKILMAVGGWNMGSYPFEQITKDDKSIDIFVQSVMKFLDHYRLDGLDLDWEYPAGFKTEFTNLCRSLKREFISRNYLLTAAVSAGTANIDSYYEPRILDFINIMTYDFHGQWDTSTQGISHHSPLNARSDEKDWVRDFNVRAATKAWEMACGGRDKLVIGIPTYGKSYRTKTTSRELKFGDKAVCGPIGPVRKSNEWAFFEVCEAKTSPGWRRGWHREHEVPFMQKDDVVVTYDNPVSAARKAMYIKYNNYGGAMFWTIDFDDFNGRYCGQQSFPIIKAVRSIFER